MGDTGQQWLEFWVVDLMALDMNGHLVTLRNERSGRIYQIESMMPNTMQDLVVGDFNNDGWMDIAWIGEDGAAYIGKNTHFNSFVPTRIGGNGHSLVAFDADNNMWLDLGFIKFKMTSFLWSGSCYEKVLAQ